MTTRKTYAYRVLQYRHDPVAGELINVGVMVHSADAGFLDIRARSTLGRLKGLYTDLNRAMLTSALDSMKSATAIVARDVAGLLSSTMDIEEISRRIVGPGDGCFVWGPVGSGFSVDLPAVLERLYARFVERHDTHTTHRRSDDDIWRPVRQMLEQREILDKLKPKVIYSSIDRVEFRHSWENGKHHCHLPMTFDYINGDHILDKARRWAGILLFLADSEEKFKPYFLLGAPQDSRLNREYDIARRMLEKSPSQPEVFEEGDLEAFVDRIEDGIRRRDAVHGGDSVRH